VAQAFDLAGFTNTVGGGWPTSNDRGSGCRVPHFSRSLREMGHPHLILIHSSILNRGAGSAAP